MRPNTSTETASSQSWTFDTIVLRGHTGRNLLVNGLGAGNIFHKITTQGDVGGTIGVLAAYPLYNVEVAYTDNRFMDLATQGSSIAGWIDTSAGTFLSGYHSYGFGYTAGILGSSSFNVNIYADSIPTNGVGFLIPGTYTNVRGVFSYVQAGSGQVGVQLVKSNGFNVVTAIGGQDLTKDNMVVPLYGTLSDTSNYVEPSPKLASYSAVGNSSALAVS